MPFGLVSTLAFYQVAMQFVSAVSVLVANTPIVSARLLESLQLAFDKRIVIGARGVFETCVANGKIVVGMPCISISLAIEVSGAGISFLEEVTAVCVYSADLKPNVSFVQLAIAPHRSNPNA